MAKITLLKPKQLEAQVFRQNVFALDKHCIACGGEANDPHHIVRLSHCPKWARSSAKNGCALCRVCHKLEDKDGATWMLPVLEKYRGTKKWRWDWAYGQLLLRREREQSKKKQVKEIK